VTVADSLCQSLQQQTQQLSNDLGQRQQQLTTAQQQLTATGQQLALCQADRDALQQRFDNLSQIDTDVWSGPPNPNCPPPAFAPKDARKTRFVAFLNLKGGVGKTTLVANLGAAYATGVAGRQLRVLLIDLDYQGSLSRTCISAPTLSALRSNRNTSAVLLVPTSQTVPPAQLISSLSAGIEGTDDRAKVIAADGGLERADFQQQAIFIVQQTEVRFRHLKIFHDSFVLANFDLVFFDCPPRLTTSTVNALVAADYIVVPTSLHPHDVEAVPRTLHWRNELQAIRGFQATLLGVVLNRTFRPGTVKDVTKDEGIQLARLYQSVQQFCPTGNAVLDQLVPNSPEVARFAAGSVPLGVHPSGHGVYAEVAKELIRRMSLT
jgi:chromosome partitioning protein